MPAERSHVALKWPFAGARRRHAAAAAAAARHGDIEWPQPALAPPPSIPKQHPHIACPEPGLASQGRPRCWPWCLWAPPMCTSRRWLWLWLCGHACGRHRVWRAADGRVADCAGEFALAQTAHEQRANSARTAHEQRANSVQTTGANSHATSHPNLKIKSANYECEQRANNARAAYEQRANCARAAYEQ